MKMKRLLSSLLILATLAVSGCNRGYGCPTNLSVEELVGVVLTLPL